MPADMSKLLPQLPPAKSFADYGDAATLRQKIMEQIGQMVAAGLFKPADFTGVKKEEVQIPTRDRASLRALHYRPESGTPGPLLVFFHGGGFVFGFAEMGENGFEVLVKELGFTIVSVDYRLAPENVFPTAAYDAIDALRWVCQLRESTELS